MSSDYDASEFVDGDFQKHRSPHAASPGAAGPDGARAPTREEVDFKVAEAQQRLAEIMREKEELERQRSALEETRRRQMEFQTGRQEMVQNLTRGLGLLQEAEFNARRDAEQMAKSMAGLREVLAKVEAIQEESWTKDNFHVELTRGLTTVENARMEWNTARLKFPVLTDAPAQEEGPAAETPHPSSELTMHSFGELCRLGLALTWPLAAVLLLSLIGLLAVLLRR